MSQTCRLGRKKRTKYINRIIAMLKAPETSLKLLEQVTGNLGYAAWVEPFCRPLLSCLYAAIARHKQPNQIRITSFMRNALRIWHLVLHHNRGLPFTFLLDKLPAVRTPILWMHPLLGALGACTGLTTSQCHTTIYARPCKRAQVGARTRVSPLPAWSCLPPMGRYICSHGGTLGTI